MTPARFDLLYCVRQVGLSLGAKPRASRLFGIEQAALGRALGLQRSTVSKMLKRLEGMGWVERSPATDDRRQKYVRLSEEGLRRIWRAMRRVFRPRLFLGRYERIAKKLWPDDHALIGVERMFRTVADVARELGDSATLWYNFDFYDAD